MGICFSGAAGQIRTATAHSAGALCAVMLFPLAALAQWEVGSSISKYTQKSRYPNGYLLFWSCWADSNCRPHPYQGLRDFVPLRTLYLLMKCLKSLRFLVMLMRHIISAAKQSGSLPLDIIISVKCKRYKPLTLFVHRRASVERLTND